MIRRQIFIRASSISVLIGLSPYKEKLGITFKNLLVSNLKNDFVDSDDFDHPDVTDIISQDITTSKILNSLKDEVRKTTNDLELINRCEKYLNCKFGKQQEKIILNEYVSKHGIVLNNKSAFKTKQIFSRDNYDIVITGSPDATTQTGEIIEIKTRIRDRIVNKIKPCDETQIQCYLNIFESDVGILDNNKHQLCRSKLSSVSNLFDLILS